MATFQFTVEDTTVADTPECQITPSAFEDKLLTTTLPYALDALRQRLLHVMTSDHFAVRSTRVLLQTATETELRALLVKMITIAPGVEGSVVCLRRRYNDIDTDMEKFSFLVEPALTELESIVPETYSRMVRRFLACEYARYRVSALSTMICLAVAHQ
jgi:hypothetical protein